MWHYISASGDTQRGSASEPPGPLDSARHPNYQILENTLWTADVERNLKSLLKGKGKGEALVIASQVDTATTEALRYMARTKQRRT